MSLVEVITPEIEDKVFETFGKTRAEFMKDVQILKEWLKCQKHLPEVMDDHRIRNFLLLSKGSIERAKPKMDMYYTVRSLLPEIYENSNPKKLPQKNIKNIYQLSIGPKLTPEMYRIIFLKMHPDIHKYYFDSSNNDLLAFYSNLFEIRLGTDLWYGDVYLIDFQSCTLDVMLTWGPLQLKKLLTVLEGVYSIRVKKAIIFNAPSYITTLVGLLKMVLKPKIFSRIVVTSEGYEVLHKHLPLDCLPLEYGGTCGSQKDWEAKFFETYYTTFQSRFDTLDRLKVNENLRPDKLKNSEVLGYHGSFKKLDLD